MSEKRKDHKGRILKTGEYWDPKGRRYMFRKMVDGERVTITDDDLIELRKKENELLHQIDRGRRISSKSAKTTLNEYFEKGYQLVQNLIASVDFESLKIPDNIMSTIQQSSLDFLGNLTNWAKSALTNAINFLTSIPTIGVYTCLLYTSPSPRD